MVGQLDAVELPMLEVPDATTTALPALARLTIAGGSYALPALAVPTVRRASFLAKAMSSAAVTAIAAAPWPVLERLELRLARYNGACEADFHDLRPLLVRGDLPALTHLRLRGAPFAGAIARAVATSPVARRLQVLDLSGGSMSPQDVAALVHHAGNFADLRELWLPAVALTRPPPGLASVAKHVLPDTRRPIDTLEDALASVARAD
jgi:hypothetical protein